MNFFDTVELPSISLGIYRKFGARTVRRRALEECGCIVATTCSWTSVSSARRSSECRLVLVRVTARVLVAKIVASIGMSSSGHLHVQSLTA